MAKPNRESDSDDGTATKTSGYNTIFIDTNLDTHLITIVSDSDTVSDLRKKIMIEHPQCFPDFGEIKIHALKVKRKGYFYHLSDSMLFKSAFDGARKSWFLSVDASSLKQHGDNQFTSKLDVALPCVTKTPSGDRNNLLPDSSSKTLSLLDTSPLPQIDTSALPQTDTSLLLQPGIIQHMNQKVPESGQSCPGEVLKNKETEVTYVTDDLCKNLSCDSKRLSDFEVEKNDQLSEGNKIPETNVEHRDGDCQVGVSDVQCNDSLEGSLKTGPPSKKRGKSKKTSEDDVSGFTLNDNNVSNLASDIYGSRPEIIGPEFSSGNTGKEVINEMEMVSVDVGKEPCKTSFSDINIRSASAEIPKTQVECGNMIGDVHCNDTLVEATKSMSTAKKKRKRENEGAGNPSGENKYLLSNSNKETSKPNAINPEKSVDDKQKTTTATSDCLFTEPPEDVHLVASPSRGKNKRKRKRKKKKQLPSSHDQVVTPEPISLHNVGEESLKETVDIVAMDSNRLSDAVIVSESNVQRATLSGPSGDSQMEKHPESVQEVVEGNKLPSSSIGIDVSGPDAENAKGRSGSKATKNSKKHHSTNVKEFPQLVVNEFDNLKKDVTDYGHENIVTDDDKVETSCPDKIEEQRKLPQNCDPEAMLSEKCEPLNQGEADVGTKAAVALSNLSETNIVMGSAKSAGSKRIKKTAKKSVATKLVTSSTEHTDNSTSGLSSTTPRSIFTDHSSVKAKKVKNISAQTERTEILKPKIVDTSFIGANREGDDMSGNGVESFPLTQVNRTQGNAENVDGNSRKKSKKNRSSDAKALTDSPVKEQANKVGSLQLNQSNMIRRSEEKMDEESGKKKRLNQNTAAKSLPDFPAKEQEFGGEELTPSNGRQIEVDTTSRTKRKSKSVKTNSKNQLTGQELEHGSFHPQQILKTVDSTQVPLSDVDDSALKNGNMDNADGHIEVSKCDGDMVNFKDYFVSVEHKHEVTPVELVVDKASEERRSAGDMKAKKKAKKLVVTSSATSPDLQNSLKLYVNQGSERKSHGRNSSHVQCQESLSKDEHNEVGLHSKSSKVSKNVVKAPDSDRAEQIKTIPQEAKQVGAVNGSKTIGSVPAHPKRNNESSSATTLGSESSEKNLRNRKETKHQLSMDRHHAKVSKASSKTMGKVVNSSRSEKGLLATPGAIFGDGSSESSEDESGAVNSDATTRTPSDNSSSSGSSEVESKSNLDSPRNGSNGAKEKDGKNIIKSQVPSPKNITMNMILRSSRRFKKAKHAATQLQLEDTESQPVDIVPDSQVNQ
ncbi:microtubule-associated protein futsch-like isoform X2 [Camellia sinensis]|uniref:microtubule-associated protein futsch-like isoform X2 n=1 Tax=Camellia sinensis TaxID=4442 RepID=UPI0010362139|nr:microtubule-associated protein futsch-like isoform X2 [Camellia sinensis]